MRRGVERKGKTGGLHALISSSSKQRNYKVTIVALYGQGSVVKPFATKIQSLYSLT